MTAVQTPMPDRLGPYRLLEKIGEGGMGVVHLARDAEGRPVAIKVLRPGVAADPDARRRLGREFETMRRVRSPFVADVIDADVTGDMAYLVTRYVAGRTLDQLVAADGPLRGRALERLAWGLAEGLAAVHAAGVVHRDLKPANVVIAGGVPVLIDFGIAQPPDATRITQAGMFMGTPGYLAPEVVEGHPSGPSADVHSWGSTVAYAATGRPPFGTGSYESIFYRIISGQPDIAGVPARLMPLLAAALSRDPGGRPSAIQLSTDCAALDLSAGLAGAAGAAGLAGAAAAAVAAAPAVAAALPLAQWTRELPGASGADSFADLLPPVSYRNGTDPAVAPSRPAKPARTGSSVRVPRLLSLVTMVIAVAVSLLLPVAGTIVSLAVIVALRAAERAQAGLSRRRSGREARATDIVVAVLTAPWAVLRALLATLLLAPLALTVAALAAAVSLIVTHPLAAAGGYAAGALIAFYGFGPSSRAPRRQLAQIFGAVTRTRSSAAVSTFVVAAVALGAATVAVSHPHLYWPMTSLPWHWQTLSHLAATVQSRLQHL